MAELLGTVRRALRVLDYLADAEEPVPIKRLAAELGLNISSAYHVVNTLVVDGYVARAERSGAYGLGAKAARLGEAYGRAWPVEPELRAIVGELGARTGENAYLAMLHGKDVVITDIVESRQRVRVHALHRGYSGGLREHFSKLPPRRITLRTQVTMTAIETEPERVRRRGYGEDLEEFCEGVCCVGAAFFARDGRPAGSVSVSVPSFRYRSVRSAVRDAVLDAARAATCALDAAHRRVCLG